jgi:hypothetical protein
VSHTSKLKHHGAPQEQQFVQQPALQHVQTVEQHGGGVVQLDPL